MAETDQSVTNQLKNRLKPYENFLVVKFSKENQQILDCIQATIQENVDLITNIPIKLKEQIQVQVTQAVSRGRDHKYLEEQLAKTGRFTENRVKLIARDQIDKATSAISHARQAELGITKQTWVYTFVSKEARQSHKAANGKVYEISKGCKIDGEYIYPAQKINCKCTSAIVLEFD